MYVYSPTQEATATIVFMVWLLAWSQEYKYNRLSASVTICTFWLYQPSSGKCHQTYKHYITLKVIKIGTVLTYILHVWWDMPEDDSYSRNLFCIRIVIKKFSFVTHIRTVYITARKFESRHRSLNSSITVMFIIWYINTTCRSFLFIS